MALWVGVALGGEVLTGWVYLAMPLVFGALALILYGVPLLGWVQRQWPLSGSLRQVDKPVG